MIWIWCLGGPESGQRIWCLWWERGAATKRKLLDLVRWIVRDENGRAPPSPRPLACSWVDARMAEDMDMVPWWPRKEGRQRQGTVGSGAVWIDCHGYNRTRLAV